MIGPFKQIAEDIFNRYKNAKLARIAENKSYLAVNDSGSSNRKLKPEDMGYFVKARNHCRRTRGRFCGMELRSNTEIHAQYNKDVKLHFNSCDNLCCGRGYIRSMGVKELNCKCRFSYSRMDIVCKRCFEPAGFLYCK